MKIKNKFSGSRIAITLAIILIFLGNIYNQSGQSGEARAAWLLSMVTLSSAFAYTLQKRELLGLKLFTGAEILKYLLLAYVAFILVYSLLTEQWFDTPLVFLASIFGLASYTALLFVNKKSL